VKVREGLAALPAPPALLMGTNPTGTNEGALGVERQRVGSRSMPERR
jgi:hypothetical protein